MSNVTRDLMRLRTSRETLERRVQERTAELAKTNETLRAEIAARRRTEGYLHSVLETANDAIVGADADGMITLWNKKAEETFGYRADEVRGKPVTLIMPERFRPLHQAGLERQKTGGHSRLLGNTVELVGLRKGGGEFPIEISLSALEVEGKLSYTGVIRDLTERKRRREELVRARADLEKTVRERTQELLQASEVLRQEKEFAESLINTAQAIVLVLDAEGRIVRFNPHMEQISGHRLEEVQGKDWFTTFLPERDRGRIRELFWKVWHQLETRGLNPIVTKDGQEHLIDWSNTTLKNTDGEVIGVLAIGQDITERKRAETWLQSLIDTTQDAVVSIDREARIVAFNPAAERIFGYSKEEITGHQVNLLMAEPYASEHDGYIARYEKTGEAKAIGRIRTVTAQRKNGEVFPIELSLTEVAVGDEVRYAAFIRDISEKARLQEQLIEKERLAATGATAAKLAHEIGNPLNGMYLTVQLLEQRLKRQPGPPDASIQSAVGRLSDEIMRLNSLLRDFSSVYRPEKYTFEATSLPSLIEDLLEIEEPRYSELGIKVARDLLRDLPRPAVDRDKLKQALLNLCKNAVEAMPRGGTLTLRAKEEGESVAIEVGDTGDGIAPDMNIFQPFSSTKPGGTGLGLVIVRQIVAAHGAKISYKSDPGKGTTFKISLPLYAHQQE